VGFELFLQNGTAGFSVALSESGERDGDIFQRSKTCVPVMCPPLQAPENGLILSTKVYFRVIVEKFHIVPSILLWLQKHDWFHYILTYFCLSIFSLRESCDDLYA
jgi:hypothetical protein